MTVDELVDMLEQIGLTADEARVYATLSSIGSTRAGRLAAAARISRPQTYRALASLEQRGVVTGNLDRPRIFTAVPIDDLLRHLHSMVAYQRHEIRLLESEITQRFRRLKTENTKRPALRSDTLRGRAVVVERAAELYESATSDIRLLLSHPGGLGLMQELGAWQQLADRTDRRIRVRILVRRADANERLLAVADRATNVAVREFDGADDFGCLVVDGREALVILVMDPGSYPRSDRTRALSTNAPSLLAMLNWLFDARWETSADSVPGGRSVRDSDAEDGRDAVHSAN